MDREQFALGVGVTPKVVAGWIDRGYLPTVVIGKRTLVNVAAIAELTSGSARVDLARQLIERGLPNDRLLPDSAAR